MRGKRDQHESELAALGEREGEEQALVEAHLEALGQAEEHHQLEDDETDHKHRDLARRVAASHGVRKAVTRRDGPFSDYSQAPQSEQPCRRSQIDPNLS